LRPRRKLVNKYGETLSEFVFTQRGRIENAIQTLERAGK
jgi:hypothetical protein